MIAKNNNITVPTKKILKKSQSPYGSQAHRDAKEFRSKQEEARLLVKPILPVFHGAMKNGVG